MTIQNLALRQIMASIAYLAYCGEQITTPNPEPQILDLINTAMPKIPPIATPNPIWRVVWGPVAYTVPGALYQDNLMFVVQNQTDTTQFAIAIRGTNFISELDWLMEDFDILQTISWPPGPAGAQISEASSIGLEVLLAMRGKCSFSDHATLLEFLGSQSATPIKLCVTGHSLGGCLAGTFALYLKENRANWDRSSSSVCCITFAAPTAGNATFATASDEKFEGGDSFPGWDASLGSNCDAVRCSLDLAPLAWTTAAVTIPGDQNYPPVLTIYVPNLDFDNLGFEGAAISTMLKNYVSPQLIKILSPCNYQQIVAGAASLVGAFNQAYKPAQDEFGDYVSAFVQQAEYQHSDSYPALLGVSELNDPTIIITNPFAPLTAPAQRPRGRPRGAAPAQA
jgi:hypothetical protein